MHRHLFFILLFFSFGAFAQERIEVFFDFNKHELDGVAAAKIEAFLETHQRAEVLKIFGFCDSKGTNLYNDTLSIKRVNEVYRFLQSKGITIRKEYEKKGFGEDFRQSQNDAENRKVLIVFEEKAIANPIPEKKSLTDQVKTAKKGDKIKLQHINFLNNSPTIVPKSKAALDELLCILQDNLSLKIEIQGHICCQLMGDKNNVSTARAKAVYNFLVRYKIDKNRLSFKGFGTSNPIYKIPEKNEEEADANRRVEIMIVAN